MNEMLLACAVVVLLTVAGGLVRVLRGPTAADRMLAAQLFGTAGVAVVLLLGSALDRSALWDVALLFALLAAIAAVAFVQRLWRGTARDEGA